MEPRRILVADDEVHIVQVLALKFRNAGLEVFEARDGEEALEIARRVRPHAVVTDLQMPFMSGTELAGANDPNAHRILRRGALLEHCVQIHG